MKTKFAIITQEVLLRRGELAAKDKETGKIGKNALETLFLYTVILLHSWRNGTCDYSIGELCRIYGLDKQNSYRRLRILRDRGWVENKKKFIKPILTYRANDKKDFENDISTGNSKGVVITPDSAENFSDFEEILYDSEENFSESVITTPFENVKSVIITPEKCNNYTFNPEKSVIITPENAATANADNDYSQSNSFKTNINKTVNPATASNRTDGGGKNNNLSEFSQSECLLWAKRRKENGERIENVVALAQWAYKTGDADDFIYILLYPNGTDDNGRRKPRRVTAERRESVLRDLRSFSASEFELIEEEWRETFTPEDWNWLIENK